jgi:hypothetical protein
MTPHTLSEIPLATPDLEAVMIQAHRDYRSAVLSFATTRTDGARARMNRANQAWFKATNRFNNS